MPRPADLWQQAISLGQACRQIGRSVLSLDLLIAAVALHHNALLVSFDADFEVIASVSALRLTRLNRPA
ncbi:MAG: PIN domain-containing protein [Cyanobacteria bacterium]|nr:PIN domain-containing protein [Cyanobacteriota bacterium]